MMCYVWMLSRTVAESIVAAAVAIDDGRRWKRCFYLIRCECKIGKWMLGLGGYMADGHELMDWIVTNIIMVGGRG